MTGEMRPKQLHVAGIGKTSGAEALHTHSRLALSPNEAAATLGVSRDYFDEHVAPELRIVRRGRRRLIAVRELERWLNAEASRTVGP
jgi:excisionase family DNA binding protein